MREVTNSKEIENMKNELLENGRKKRQVEFIMGDQLFALYTVRRIKKGVEEIFGLTDDNLYNTTHASDYGDKTVCGIELDNNWYIWNNTFDGIITCKKCLKIIKERLEQDHEMKTVYTIIQHKRR